MLALVFRIGSDRLALDVRRIKEVVPRVHLQTLACSPSWLAGTFVYRGRVVPVVDLHRLAGVGECPLLLSSRIILVPLSGCDDRRLLGLLAAEVADLQELEADGQALTRLHQNGQPDLGPVLADRHGVLRLLDLDQLLPESVRGSLLTLTPWLNYFKDESASIRRRSARPSCPTSSPNACAPWGCRTRGAMRRI